MTTTKLLDLSAVITDPKGNPHASGQTYAEALSSELMLSPAKGYDSIKLYEIAITLAAKKKIALDTSDMETVKRFVTNDSNLFVLAKGPILKAFSEAKAPTAEAN